MWDDATITAHVVHDLSRKTLKLQREIANYATVRDGLLRGSHYVVVGATAPEHNNCCSRRSEYHFHVCDWILAKAIYDHALREIGRCENEFFILTNEFCWRG